MSDTYHINVLCAACGRKFTISSLDCKTINICPPCKNKETDPNDILGQMFGGFDEKKRT